MTTETESKTGQATYSPEDNKLRLYVGRVPREEFLKLRADGWVTLHKQREAGGGDFAATWTPSRRDTCLEYADLIEDEDMGPAERSADRAERFGDYRDNRTGEATGHADKYDSGPAVHGYQSEALAERSATRHDRQATRATDAWSKAEYWTARTAGVIRHALHVAAPGVRMGRIKRLESELRRFIGSGGEWETHLTLRLAYENQMLAAQGGRLEQYEILVGGKIGGKLIIKVSKSSVTKRATSVDLLGPKVTGWNYKVSNIPGTEWAAYKFDTERIKPGSYTPPTSESLVELEAYKTATKVAKSSGPKALPLINPTDEDAERLQAIWNTEAARRKGFGYNGDQPVRKISQADYSACSSGMMSTFETVEITGGGFVRRRCVYGSPDCPAVAKVRANNQRVIVLADKPQKPLPPEVWDDPRPGMAVELEQRFGELETMLRKNWLDERTPAERDLFNKAIIVHLCYESSRTQYGFTDAGHEWAKRMRDRSAPKKAVSKFWNCGCGFIDETSAVYDEKACPNCGCKMHNDIKTKEEFQACRARQYEELDRKRAEAGADSINAETGEMAFK